MEQTVDPVAEEMPYQIVRSGQCLSVTFSDEQDMDELGYKILNGISGTNLLCGTKSLFNGKLKLTYDISDYTPLTSLRDGLTREQVFEIVEGLLDTLEQIYDIGFLLYDNVSFRAEDVLLKNGTCQVCLLYIPNRAGRTILRRPEYDRIFCGRVQGILSSIPAAKTMTRFFKALSSPRTLVQLRELLHQEISNPPHEPEPVPGGEKVQSSPGGRRWFNGLFWKNKEKPKEGKKPEVWRLVGINTPGPLELALTGESFVVGRSVQRAQGVVSFSPTIGREHCRFLLKDGKWYLEDLNSTNGTFLNGKRLEAGKEYAVSPEDRVRLSSTEFRLQKE